MEIKETDENTEYLSVKVIIQKGDVEITYDVHKAIDFSIMTEFKEPPYVNNAKQENGTRVQSLAFTMYPVSNDEDTYMVVTRTTKANKVYVKEEK